MKTLLIALVGLAGALAHAETPNFPDNIEHADACSYHSWTAKLTCRDDAGNVLIKDQKVFKKFRVTAYPLLPMFAAMKRLGFEGKAVAQIGDDVELIFTRPVRCR